MKRSIPIAGIAVMALVSVGAAVLTVPGARGAEVAPVRATQNAGDDIQATLETACATCHDLTAVQPGLYTMAEWQVTIDRMISYGTTLTTAQTNAILAYLGTDAPAAAAGDNGGAANDEAAQALLESSCTTCHDLTAVERGVFSSAEWTETINRMLGYGLTLSEDQINLLVGYLASDAGGDTSEGEADPAAAQAAINATCTTCHDLMAVQPDLYTAAEWRETIDRMLGYGAAVTDEQAELIINYLATDR